MANHSELGEIRSEGVGSFTPPPAPCGDTCHYILAFNSDGSEKGWEIEHGEECSGTHSH